MEWHTSSDSEIALNVCGPAGVDTGESWEEENGVFEEVITTLGASSVATSIND